MSTTMPTCPSGSTGAYATHGAASGSTPSNSEPGCYEPRYSKQCYTAASRGARARANTTRCAEPTTGSRLAASVGESTSAPATRFPIWTRLSRREVRASTRLCAGGGSCLRDLWHAWKIRDCRSAWCLEKWWGGWAVWGARKKSGWGVSWTTSELSASMPTSGRLQRPGRGGMAQDGRTRGGTFHGEMDCCRESQGWTTACSGMPERDGKDQGEDSPKQADSCWFARPCWLATSEWRELVSSGRLVYRCCWFD